MTNAARALMVVATLASGQVPPSVEFHYLYTFGSKEGIHPHTVLNRRAATIALGKPENAYGLLCPESVVTDLQHRVWIADSGTASVHVFGVANSSYREIRRAGDWPLQQPAGLAADGQGRIFLTDAASGGLFSFDEKGEYDYTLVKPGDQRLETPTAIALSADGKTIYVVDRRRSAVVALNREGEVNQTFNLPPELVAPAAISVIHNQIYVLGSQMHRVGIFSPAGKQRGDIRWDGIDFPAAFTYDAGRRRFLVANPRWMVIEIFNEEGKNLGAFGQLGNGVDQMQRVDSLHVDSQGLLYLVDSRHGKVLVFSESRHAL